MWKRKHDYEHHIVDPEMYDDMVAFITPEAMEEADLQMTNRQEKQISVRIEEKIERKI